MTFRVFFCAGVCGLLPQADASGLMPPVCPVPAISSEQVCLGSLNFSTLSPGISLECALAEGACSPHTADGGVFPGLIKLAACVLWQFRWGRQSKAGLAPCGYA